MAEGPNDREWQLGLATHEWNAQKNQYPLALEPDDRGEARSAVTRGRTIRGEASTRKPGFDGTMNGGGVRPRNSRKSVETRSTE